MISGLTPDFVAEKKSANIALEIRKARMQDSAPVLELINGYAARGIMLPPAFKAAVEQAVHGAGK